MAVDAQQNSVPAVSGTNDGVEPEASSVGAAPSCYKGSKLSGSETDLESISCLSSGSCTVCGSDVGFESAARVHRHRS